MEKRNCPICGAELSREDVFCGNCGTKIQDTEGIPRRITGLIITIAGLFLLLYSFFTAYDFVSVEFILDETFVVRFIFLICMIGIGSYLAGKGASLPGDSRIIGIILAATGLFMLCFSFIIANTFVNGEYIFDDLFFGKIIFFFCMIGIGGYLTGKGVPLTAYPKITGLILTPIGVIMLLFSFITANAFVSGEFIADDTIIIIIRIIYFICMIGIGGYLIGKGVSELWTH
jgi:predicted nucleic acid-binding Zn ribbon protein